MCYGFQMNSNVPFTEVGASLWEIILASGHTKSFIHIIPSLLRPSITFWIFRNSRQPNWPCDGMKTTLRNSRRHATPRTHNIGLRKTHSSRTCSRRGWEFSLERLAEWLLKGLLKVPYFNFFIPSPCTPVQQGHTSNYPQTLWTSKKKTTKQTGSSCSPLFAASS